MPYKEGDLAVRERHPLKQGLKLDPGHDTADIIQVRERHPLKQGLKPSLVPPVRRWKAQLEKGIH